MKKILLLAVIGMIAFTSCKKDDPIVLTPKDHLTKSAWKVQSKNGTIDDCRKDDLFTYNTDGNFILDFGVKCPSDLVDTVAGTWTLFDDDSKIQIKFDLGSFGSKIDTLSVIKLNEDNLEYIDKDGETWIWKH